ncbi:hypothetical protein L2E82_04867 [Cichorium intybus]|uniref:Uncharacterized protein n=1 Tax=Cichorium intybus TaxID=13427 RepID=A0ACB9H642_CICIN|nr:hypothetical protein L2E82_04867 [Cichorium intybus]
MLLTISPRVSMAGLGHDLLELILKRLNVADLIRCKSVCKSWETFISDSRFVKVHMEYSYQVDCNNNDVDRRIVMARTPYLYGSSYYEFDDRCFDYRDCHLLGSSNGLVCISPFASQILVANPCTREVKTLKTPQIPYMTPLCWGFGHDSSTDDYKVILGFKKGNGRTYFQVLTLKSNVWKVIGDVNYSFVSRIGILCNGALHWVMRDASSQDKQNVIFSFHLSEEEFKEIPQPDDAEYESGIARLPTMRLGIMAECLCVFHYDKVTDKLWMMKNYNVKESWEMVGKDCEIKFVVHCLKELKHYISYKRSLCRHIWFFRTQEFIAAPIYLQTLVSPHLDGRPKRKMQASNIKKSCKLIKGDPSFSGPSGNV